MFNKFSSGDGDDGDDGDDDDDCIAYSPHTRH